MAALTTDADGNVKLTTAGGTTSSTVILPLDIQLTDLRPSAARYSRKRLNIVVGQFSPGLAWTEHYTAHALGIQAPANAPTLAATSGGSITGSCIGRLAYRHKVGQQIIAESSMSAASSTASLVGQARAWTNVPTTAPNHRVTHVVGYVSVDGAELREAWERELGSTSSVTEAVATGSLGAVGSLLRDVPPPSRYVEIYHERAWYASVTFPDRVYYSELGEPESVDSLSYLVTRDGEHITGLKKVRDYLVVFTKRSIYTIQGFQQADFQFEKVEPGIGCIAGHAVVNIHDRLWFPSEYGVYIFDGTTTPAMKDLSTYWRDDYLTSATTRAQYEDAVAIDDRYVKCYKLLINKTSSPQSFYYVGHYENFEPKLGSEQSQPQWVFYIRARKDSALGTISAPQSLIDEIYTGSCDGYVRKENVDSDDDDDDDSYAKALTIRTGHWLFNDPGGGRQHGKSLVDWDVFMVSENNTWTPKVWGGDEDAYTALTPMFSATVAASALAGYNKKSVHHFRPTKCSGRGFTFEFTASSPLAMEYRGLAGTWKAGIATRPKQS